MNTSHAARNTGRFGGTVPAGGTLFQRGERQGHNPCVPSRQVDFTEANFSVKCLCLGHGYG